MFRITLHFGHFSRSYHHLAREMYRTSNAGNLLGSDCHFVPVPLYTRVYISCNTIQRGETPDSKSRKLQQMAQDFGNACTGIGKGLGKKGTDSVKAYNAAAVILEQYLKGTELEPIGSPYYDSLE